MSDPTTRAGRDLLVRYPDLVADEIVELERQARGQGTQAARERVQRLIDALRRFPTPEQLGTATALLTLDPDVTAALDDDTVRFVLDALTRMPNPGSRGPRRSDGGLARLP